MGKIRFVLSNFWLWATLLFGCIFAENLALFSSNPREGYNNTTFLMIAICCFFCLGVYLYLEHRRNHVKFDKILFPIMIGLGVIFLGTIFMQNSETFVFENGKDSVTVAFSVGRKLKYGIKLVFLMAFSYITTFTMFANRSNNRSLLWLPVVLLAVVYISVGYSALAETDVIVSYFRSVSRQSIKSFFLNPNTFGLTLLLGIMACFVINYYKPNAFTYLSIPLFLFLIILTYSAASILVAFVIVPLYFVVEIFRNIKKHFFITISISAFIIISLAVFAVLIANLADHHNLFVENIISSIKHFIDNIDFDTYTGRTKAFEGFIKYGSDSVLHTIFGRGYGTSDEYIPAMYSAIRNGPHSMSCENGFVQIFITFGLVGLFVYILLLGVFFYSCVKLFVNRYRTFALTYAICVLGLVANCFAETNVFYDLGFKETTMTLIFLMPPIVKAKFLTHKEKIAEIKEYKVAFKFNALKVGEYISMIILAAMASVGACFLSPYAMNNPKVFLIILASLGGSLLIFPYLISMWLKSEDPIMRVIHVSVNLIALFAFVYVTFVIVKNQGPMHYNYIYSGAAAFIFIIFDLVIYAIIRKDFFVSYLKITFINPLIATFPSYICGFAITVIFILVTLPMGQFAEIETFGVGLFYFLGFMFGVFFIPYRPMKKNLNMLNDAIIYRWKKFELKGDK